ncbi:ricin B lectin domain-containing protein [Suillus plorans]|uniref:Ricin B lectin domain-containing protein n=1 Tax=Suillus plorans TaxID=116603 RepID=A0A9P7AR00_9AGAM|nr:ricin B lectin domain-containing protein [Suillus plorans]KAG1794562.1 ricin B lectin domain-containing protein [Suillus plorans]
MVYGKNFSLDLDGGKLSNHTRIHLWESGGSSANQIWALTEWVSIKDQHTYSLKNCRGGTTVDLSGNDNYSIIGFTPHDGPNQAWTFQRDGDKNGWFIKSCRTEKYLGIEGNPQNGLAVVAVSNPFKWDIEDSDVKNAKGIRILVHGTNFSLDLSASDHTKIQLWGSGAGDNQIWELTERVSIEDQHIYSLENRQRGPKDQGTDPKACFHPMLV